MCLPEILATGGQAFPDFPGGWEMSLHGKLYLKGKYSWRGV